MAASNNNIDKQSKSKKSIDTSKKSITQNSLVSDEILKEKKKNIVIEIVNTDKPNNATKNISLGEERKNQDTESNNSKKSGNNLIKNMNKKNDKGSRNSKDKKKKKIDESKQSLNNNREEYNSIIEHSGFDIVESAKKMQDFLNKICLFQKV